MREATAEEVANWDQLVVASPNGGNVLQGLAFARLKSQFGWKPFYAVYEESNQPTAVLYLRRQVPGLGELWYATKGPSVATATQLASILGATRPQGAFMLKIDPELLPSAVTPKQLTDLGLLKTRDIQYNTTTVIVDLTPDEITIINSFKSKTRYNINLAARKGVVVETVPTNATNIAIMYGLMQATQVRAGFYLRSREYFRAFWQLHADLGSGQLFLASFEGKVLAGAFVTFLGAKSLYKDGGSVREHSELQAPYALQWEIMRWLKGRGVHEYDLHGVPPLDSSANHPLAGLAQFKHGFNDEITTFIGTYDLPLRPSMYRLWQKAGERTAQAYYYRVKKELFY